MYQHGSSITCFAEVDADDITDGSVASCSVFLWLASSEDLRLSLVDVTSKTILREIPLLYQVAKVSEATGLFGQFIEACSTKCHTDDQAPGRAVLVPSPLEDLVVGGIRHQGRVG